VGWGNNNRRLSLPPSPPPCGISYSRHLLFRCGVSLDGEAGLISCIRICIRASEVISVRVRRELKRGLEELGVDYAEKIRRFLEELVAR